MDRKILVSLRLKKKEKDEEIRRVKEKRWGKKKGKEMLEKKERNQNLDKKKFFNYIPIINIIFITSNAF